MHRTSHCPALALIMNVCLIVCGCDGSGGGDGNGQFRVSLCTNTLYPAQENSEYILPWPVGENYLVGQGNCVAAGSGSHAIGSRAEFAYDIVMPVGTSLLAVRSGTVIYVEESYADGTRVAGEENTIVIRHADGTISNYGHLTTMGALVDVDDVVGQGDVIALSGDSGASTEPHLHFEILGCDGPPILLEPIVTFNPSCRSLPTTFRNTSPNPRGMVEGLRYDAFAF